MMLPLLLLFILIIILIRLKTPVGMALIAGALFLGIYHFGVSERLWMLLYNSVKSLSTWRLVFTVGLILTFANIFESAGFVMSMVTALETFLPPSWVARVAPAIIGLLPMPGGAMVSAPIVKHLGHNSDATPEQFTAANYWWRHVWETTWPLYPSIILAAAVLRISVWNVAIINFPISAACIVGGLLMKGIGSSMRVQGNIDARLLVKSLWPIVFIVLLGVILKVDLIFSVIFVTFVVILTRKIKAGMIVTGLRNGFSPGIVALIFGVMTLMLAIDETGIAATFYNELLGVGFRSGIVVFVVPFAVGLLTGVTSAYIGVGFPVVLPLLGTQGLSQNAGMILAFSGGFMGVMASPVHLCLVLTKDYFKASLPRTLVLLVIPILLTSAISWFLAATLYR